MLNALYLLKDQADNFYIKRLFGLYYVYHKASGDFVAKCRTQREVRNAVRAYIVGDRTHTTEGRE